MLLKRRADFFRLSRHLKTVSLLVWILTGPLKNILATGQISALEEADQAYVSGDFQGALSRYDQYLSSVTDGEVFWEAHYWKGRALLALDQIGLAEKEFLFARRHSSDLVLRDEAQMGYADCLFYVGEPESALSQYIELLDSGIVLERSYLLFQIGMIWKARGNGLKADSYFQTILREMPHSYEAGTLIHLGQGRAGGLYYIQIGLFQVKKNLDRLLVKLRDLGYSCQVDEIFHQSKKVFRLRVGGFQQESEARKVQFEIERAAAIKGHVVKE